MSVSAISSLFSVLCPFWLLYLIFYFGLCSYRGCLISLNLKKTDPKLAIKWKKCIKSSKKHHPAHTKFHEKNNFTLWSYCPNRHIITHPKMLGGTFLHLIQLIFLSSVCFFKKLQRSATFGKLQTGAILWTYHQRGVSANDPEQSLPKSFR